MRHPILYGLIVKCPNCGTRFRRGYFQQNELELEKDKWMAYRDDAVECPSCKQVHDYSIRDIAGVEHIPRATE